MQMRDHGNVGEFIVRATSSNVPGEYKLNLKAEPTDTLTYLIQTVQGQTAQGQPTQLMTIVGTQELFPSLAMMLAFYSNETRPALGIMLTLPRHRVYAPWVLTELGKAPQPQPTPPTLAHAAGGNIPAELDDEPDAASAADELDEYKELGVSSVDFVDSAVPSAGTIGGAKPADASVQTLYATNVDTQCTKDSTAAAEFFEADSASSSSTAATTQPTTTTAPGNAGNLNQHAISTLERGMNLQLSGDERSLRLKSVRRQNPLFAESTHAVTGESTKECTDVEGKRETLRCTASRYGLNEARMEQGTADSLLSTSRGF